VKVSVLKRSGYRCELCKAVGGRLDLHHVFGRGNRSGPVGQTWADSAECCASLCAGPGTEDCHGRISNGGWPAGDETLRRAATLRLVDALTIAIDTDAPNLPWIMGALEDLEIEP